MNSQTSFASNRKFFDDENFPYGFSRSGEFTTRQCELLTTRGFAYQELAAGRRQPETDAEHGFVSFCQGTKLAESEDEKAWGRYLNCIQRPKYFHGIGIGSSRRAIYDISDDDGDLEMDAD